MHVPSLNQDFVSRFGLAPFYYTTILLYYYTTKSQNIKTAQSNIKKWFQFLAAQPYIKVLVSKFELVPFWAQKNRF